LNYRTVNWILKEGDAEGSRAREEMLAHHKGSIQAKEERQPL